MKTKTQPITDSIPVSDVVSPIEAARLLGVFPASLTRMMDGGTLAHVQTADGKRLVPVAEVERLRAAREAKS